MCMTCREEVSLAEVSAFKIFTRDEKGLLQSTFVPTFKAGLKYPPNERIRVDDEEATFFAFKNVKTAISIARDARKKWGMRWNIVKGDLLVLPVTMYEVVAEGKYHVPSEDSQCMDGYHPAYESKEIIVHDTQENRNQFYDIVIGQYFDRAKLGMSAIDKEALTARVPHIAEFIK